MSPRGSRARSSRSTSTRASSTAPAPPAPRLASPPSRAIRCGAARELEPVHARGREGDVRGAREREPRARPGDRERRRASTARQPSSKRAAGGDGDRLLADSRTTAVTRASAARRSSSARSETSRAVRPPATTAAAPPADTHPRAPQRPRELAASARAASPRPPKPDSRGASSASRAAGACAVPAAVTSRRACPASLGSSRPASSDAVRHRRSQVGRDEPRGAADRAATARQRPSASSRAPGDRRGEPLDRDHARVGGRAHLHRPEARAAEARRCRVERERRPQRPRIGPERPAPRSVNVSSPGGAPSSTRAGSSASRGDVEPGARAAPRGGPPPRRPPGRSCAPGGRHPQRRGRDAAVGLGVERAGEFAASGDRDASARRSSSLTAKERSAARPLRVARSPSPTASSAVAPTFARSSGTRTFPCRSDAAPSSDTGRSTGARSAAARAERDAAPRRPVRAVELELHALDRERGIAGRVLPADGAPVELQPRELDRPPAGAARRASRSFGLSGADRDEKARAIPSRPSSSFARSTEGSSIATRTPIAAPAEPVEVDRGERPLGRDDDLAVGVPHRTPREDEPAPLEREAAHLDAALDRAVHERRGAAA